ncbi:MAG: Gfo/Idh/MocA family oxidoreductase, partial [bacterium]|nr:Gfo/Idh/MocA family oxidoreductase [bacterium]
MAIRTAILGYGRSGSSLHAGPIERNEAFDLVAACDIDPERREQAAERFGCAVYDDY